MWPRLAAMIGVWRAVQAPCGAWAAACVLTGTLQLVAARLCVSRHARPKVVCGRSEPCRMPWQAIAGSLKATPGTVSLNELKLCARTCNTTLLC